MNVQEHETFCEPGLENIRKSEECWDDVTWRTVWRKHSRNLVTMKWCSGRLSTICLHLLTLRLLSTPDGQQTQPAHTHTHTQTTLFYRSVTSRLVRSWMTVFPPWRGGASWSFMYSLRMSCTALYTLKVSRGSGSSLRNVFRITAGTWTSAYWSKSTGLPAHVQMRQIFIDTPTSTQTQWGDFSCFIIVASSLKEQSTENLCSDWSWSYLSSHQWVGLMLEILKHLLKFFIWTQ